MGPEFIEGDEGRSFLWAGGIALGGDGEEEFRVRGVFHCRVERGGLHFLAINNGGGADGGGGARIGGGGGLHNNDEFIEAGVIDVVGGGGRDGVGELGGMRVASRGSKLGDGSGEGGGGLRVFWGIEGVKGLRVEVRFVGMRNKGFSGGRHFAGGGRVVVLSPLTRVNVPAALITLSGFVTLVFREDPVRPRVLLADMDIIGSIGELKIWALQGRVAEMRHILGLLLDLRERHQKLQTDESGTVHVLPEVHILAQVIDREVVVATVC